MTKCENCGKNVSYIPFECRRCGKVLCEDCRLPEDHKCDWSHSKNFFQGLEKSTKKPKRHKQISYKEKNEEYVEMYKPGRSNHMRLNLNRHNFNFTNFLRKYIYPRIQHNVKPHLMQFLLIFIIGIVLNYVYYQTFSLTYLFIGGVNEWFSILIPTLNYGLSDSYNLFYLIINGVYYLAFYYSFALVIFNTITNLNKRDTLIMIAWFAFIVLIVTYFFPQIV